MQTIEWHERSREVDPRWTLTLRGLEVALTRVPAVAGAKPQTWGGALTARQRAALDAALEHFGAGQMPSPCYVAVGGGTLTLADEARRHVVAFSPGAEEPCSPTDWLRFPGGAATDVVTLFDSLRAAVYAGRLSALEAWSPPRSRGRPAGEAITPDQRMVLSYAASVPNAVDARRRLERVSWFASGRAVVATVWIDDRAGRQSVAVRGETRVDPALAVTAREELRKLRFFDPGVMTGSRYDGEEVVRCHDRGARLEKRLCYEVEMGARCGLSAGENAGLDLLRALARRTESP